MANLHNVLYPNICGGDTVVYLISIGRSKGGMWVYGLDWAGPG